MSFTPKKPTTKVEVKGKNASGGKNVTKGKQDTIEQANAKLSAADKETKVDSTTYANQLASNRNDSSAVTGSTTKIQSVYSTAKKAHKFVNIGNDLYGSASIVNPYALFLHPNSREENQIEQFFDGRGGETKDLTKDLTLPKLLSLCDPKDKNIYNKNGVAPYYANDFLYAKYYELIPLNHLITLRRYPFPVYDSLVFGQEGDQFKPLAQAITYFGEPTPNKLSELLKISGKVNWKEIEGPDFEKVEGNEQGLDKSPLGGELLQTAGGSNNDLSGRNQANIDYHNKISDAPFEFTGHALGPVNVVTKTSVRDRGIGANQEFSLTFEYDTKSYNGINPKIAMLDIMCNMLALAFNNAKFWGGANRYVPNSPQFGFFGDQKAFYAGDYGTYFQSVVDVAKTGLGNIGSTILNALSSILSGDLSSLKAVAGKVLGGALDIQSHKNRPNLVAFKAILTGLPVGEWHLMIGNPLKPIAMVGNLICEGFDMEYGDQLGIDDFPTELKFVVKLKSARGRDKGDVESIFNNGLGRIYYPPDGSLDLGNLSASTFADGKPTNKKKGTTELSKDNGTRKYNVAKGSVY